MTGTAIAIICFKTAFYSEKQLPKSIKKRTLKSKGTLSNTNIFIFKARQKALIF